MTVFKKGDRVRRVDGGHMGMGPGHVDNVTDCCATWLDLQKYGSGHDPEMFELVEAAPKPVIEEVTRKRINPGTIGIVSVGGMDGNSVDVSVYALADASKLREAAATFNDLADALEFNARAGK